MILKPFTVTDVHYLREWRISPKDVCPHCRGEKWIDDKTPCQRCDKSGLVTAPRTPKESP